MFTRPSDLDDEAIRRALSSAWEFDATPIIYEAVGFGSHHWIARDGNGGGRFVTVDDVSSDDATGRLRSAFATAYALRHDAGLDFVVAPVAAVDGSVLQRLNDRYVVAVYPLVPGEPVGVYGEYRRAADREAVLDLIVDVHRATTVVTRHARRDIGELRQRDNIRTALESLDEPWDRGPYGEPCRRLFSEHAAGVAALVKHYDRLADTVFAHPERMVITHGEPHPGNVMISDGNHLLIDWDTALIAAPERDLWDLDPGDGSVIDAYTSKTGTAIDDDALAFYRLWYDLDEIGGYVALFREVHDETDDVRESWTNLVHYLQPAARWPCIIS